MNIEQFAELVQKQQKEAYIGRWREFDENDENHANIVKNATTIKVKPGKKYIKIDVGHSGKLMVVIETGEIFGIKGYGIINRHPLHTYGTLETVNEWYWGEYKPFRIEVTA